MPNKSLPHNHGENFDISFAEIPKEEDLRLVAEIFKQLSDTSRIRIFWLLCHCEECVINLSAMVHMSSPAVSHHLRQLKAAGLIVNRREGKEVYYTASSTPQAQSLHKMIEYMVEVTCPSEKAQGGGQE